MRLSDEAHTDLPWRIHDIASDFEIEDVWRLPVEGGAGEFPLLIEGIASGDPAQGASPVADLLWAIRWKLGEIFGWDDPDSGLGARVKSLRDRVPAELRPAGDSPAFDNLPFETLYLTDDEFAAEIANSTVHGVMHVGWVPDGAGSYHGQMAVLVKPNGLLGRAYMLAIKPFRYFIVYPAMMRLFEKRWRELRGSASPPATEASASSPRG
jgi:hypothetical protein